MKILILLCNYTIFFSVCCVTCVYLNLHPCVLMLNHIFLRDINNWLCFCSFGIKFNISNLKKILVFLEQDLHIKKHGSNFATTRRSHKRHLKFSNDHYYEHIRNSTYRLELIHISLAFIMFRHTDKEQWDGEHRKNYQIWNIKYQTASRFFLVQIGTFITWSYSSDWGIQSIWDLHETWASWGFGETKSNFHAVVKVYWFKRLGFTRIWGLHTILSEQLMKWWKLRKINKLKCFSLIILNREFQLSAIMRIGLMWQSLSKQCSVDYSYWCFCCRTI